VRIEWDPLDAALATCVGGVVTIHEGTSTHELARDVFDVRWLADGPILTVEDRGFLRWRRDGALVDERQHVPADGHLLVGASIAASGARFIALDAPRAVSTPSVSVASPAGTVFRPRLDGTRYGGLTSAAISGDGTRLALAYDTDQAGRGIAVWDVDDQKLLDRTWAAQPIERAAVAALAFDHAGKRLATVVPEVGVASLGAIRIGAGEVYPRPLLGGATAVALENRGHLAAYAFREVPPGARGRLRFDYLETAAKGEIAVEILDTQTLEHELPDVVALAFSRDRRRLACLASTGAIEIVPVP
jgi:hypothetical protein